MVIPNEIKFIKAIAEACQDKDIILFVVPSVFVRSTAKTAAPFIPDGQIIVDVVKDLLTIIVSACEDQAVVEEVQGVFMNKNMRVYTNSDRSGVELCGALKNVIALASRICAGLGYGGSL